MCNRVRCATSAFVVGALLIGGSFLTVFLIGRLVCLASNTLKSTPRGALVLQIVLRLCLQQYLAISCLKHELM